MKNYSFLLLLSFLFFSAGCKTSSTSSLDLGTYRGNVALYGVDGIQLPQSDGVAVAIDGTNFRTTSNAHGDWQINGVPAGIYTLILSKTGFTTLDYMGDEFSGSGTSFVNDLGLLAIPNDSVTCTYAVTHSHDSIIRVGDTVRTDWRIDITGHVSGSDPIQYVVVGMSYNPSVLLNPPTNIAEYDYYNNIPVKPDRSFSLSLTTSSYCLDVRNGLPLSIGVFVSANQLKYFSYPLHEHFGDSILISPKHPWSSNSHVATIVLP